MISRTHRIAHYGRWAYPLWKLADHQQIRREFSVLSAQDPFGAPPQPPYRRVVVTGMGAVTPLAVGLQPTWERLIAGDTAVRALEENDLPPDHRNSFSSLPSKVIACVPKHELTQVPWTLKSRDPKREAPFMTYALTAAAEALADAKWHPDSLTEKQRTGVAIGAGMSCTMDMAEAGVLLSNNKLRRLSPFFVPRTLVNMAAGTVSIEYGLQGPNHAASTACSSGAHGIGDAFRMVQRGDADVMIAGGSEACIDAVALGGFARLKALSTRFNDTPAAASRPFDKDRDGFVMAEGAGILVLEELEHARSRGARIYAEIRGYGLSGDAHHITQPPADGAGAQLAMHRCLMSAGLRPSDVTYLNAHATSTPIGDDVEQRAIASVFKGEALNKLRVSSTKGAVGHLLGAAGAVEAIFTVLAVHHKVAPPTCNLENAEPQLVPGLVGGGKAVALDDGPVVGMSNSFGFGGTNASLVFAGVD